MSSVHLLLGQMDSLWPWIIFEFFLYAIWCILATNNNVDASLISLLTQDECLDNRSLAAAATSTSIQSDETTKSDNVSGDGVFSGCRMMRQTQTTAASWQHASVTRWCLWSWTRTVLRKACKASCKATKRLALSILDIFSRPAASSCNNQLTANCTFFFSHNKSLISWKTRLPCLCRWDKKISVETEVRYLRHFESYTPYIQRWPDCRCRTGSVNSQCL